VGLEEKKKEGGFREKKTDRGKKTEDFHGIRDNQRKEETNHEKRVSVERISVRVCHGHGLICKRIDTNGK
jgi:hypothetical protein